MRQLKITKQVTNRETASLDKYLQEIGKVDLITAEEEVELAQRIKKGDQFALEKLTKANLRFVVSVAKQYQNQGLTLPDLINEGNLGLIKAAQRFDETRGFKFIPYAVWWIRQSILQALAEQSRIVRLPLNKIGSINKINKTYAFLEQAHERAPSPEELRKFFYEGLTHNLYLKFLTKYGIVGLVGYLLFWVYIFTFNIKKLKRTKDSLLVKAFLAGYAGFLVASFFENNFTDAEVQYTLFFILGLNFALLEET